MINKFAGRCSRCGRQVNAGAGVATKVDGRWATQHGTTEACDAARAAYAAATSSVPAAAARRYDRIYNEGGDGYNPVRHRAASHTRGDGYCPACGDEGCYARREVYGDLVGAE